MRTKKSRDLKRGRPTLLSARLQNRICELLARGSAIKSACIVCGVSERVFYNWRDRGKAGETRFARFFSAVTRARETHKANLIERIVAAAKADWKAASWLLERQFPNDFARSQPREIIFAQPLHSPQQQQSEGPPLPQTTTYWTTTGNQIPFTEQQLAYIAKLRADYPPNEKEQNQ